MQRCSNKKFINKVEMKAQKGNLIKLTLYRTMVVKRDKKSTLHIVCSMCMVGSEKDIGYCSCLKDTVCRVLFLPRFTTIAWYKISFYKVTLSCFHLYLVSVLVTAISLHAIDFKKYSTLVHCVIVLVISQLVYACRTGRGGCSCRCVGTQVVLGPRVWGTSLTLNTFKDKPVKITLLSAMIAFLLSLSLC